MSRIQCNRKWKYNTVIISHIWVLGYITISGHCRPQRISLDDYDGQMISGEPCGPEASWHLSYKCGKNPKKSSPRKLIPTGDRTRVRWVTAAHATACPIPVDLRYCNRKFILCKFGKVQISTSNCKNTNDIRGEIKWKINTGNTSYYSLGTFFFKSLLFRDDSTSLVISRLGYLGVCQKGVYFYCCVVNVSFVKFTDFNFMVYEFDE